MSNINKMMRFLWICLCIHTYSHITADQSPKNVTIWIHGTMIPGRAILPSFAIQSFFHKRLGLTPIAEYKESDQLYKLAKTLCTASPNTYDLDHYYTFGWSGRLCFDERERAARDLYHELTTLQKEYLQHYQETPYLRIITHSHGGNLALNLAQIMPSDASLSIDELIVLACPVQEKTKYLIESPCFKKVYAFYSERDTIQIIDPQGLYKNGKSNKLFSERTFPYHKNLRQAQVRFNGHAIMHVTFIARPFSHYLPKLCEAVEEFYDQQPSGESKQLICVLDIDTKHHSEIHKKIEVKHRAAL